MPLARRVAPLPRLASQSRGPLASWRSQKLWPSLQAQRPAHKHMGTCNWLGVMGAQLGQVHSRLLLYTRSWISPEFVSGWQA